MKFDNVPFRCSALWQIMTDAKGKSNSLQYTEAVAELEKVKAAYEAMPNKQTRTGAYRYRKIQDLQSEITRLEPIKDDFTLSQTALSYIGTLYREYKFQRRQEFSSKYIEKGVQQEEDAITLLSLYLKRMLFKNAHRLTNDFITGEPDVFIGESIDKAEEGYDTKCSWSVWTFPFEGPLDPKYYWQNMGYMALTGAKRWTTAYTLVNASAHQITSEKNKIWYAMGCPDETSDRYIEKRIEVEKNMIFDMAQFIDDNPGYDLDCPDWKYDIPLSERIKLFTVERDDQAIQMIYDRVTACRRFMNTAYSSHVIIAEYDNDVNATIIS